MNLFSVLSILATILTIWSYCFTLRNNKLLSNTVKVFNILLLVGIVCLSSFYYEIVSAQKRAEVFYERYSNTSFDSDFKDSKIRAVVNDGMVIFYDLKLNEKYPVLAEEIENRYQKANVDSSFDREEYVIIARDLFGIFGSISGGLYDESYLVGGENDN